MEEEHRLGLSLMEDSFTFVSFQTFHLRATNEVERQKWLTALELAKAKALQVRHVVSLKRLSIRSAVRIK